MATAKDIDNTKNDNAADVAKPIYRGDIQPRIGSTVTVKVPKGIDLVNNETGKLFEPGKAVQVTVTVGIVRRLQDGDLDLV